MASPLSLPPVRMLRPSLWCMAAVSTFYIGCAAYEVWQDARVAQIAKLQMSRKQQLFGGDSSGDGSRAAGITQHDVDDVRLVVAKANGYSRPGRSAVRGHGHILSSSAIMAAYKSQGLWGQYSESTKVSGAIVTANGGVFLLERLLPVTSALFSHVPSGAASMGMGMGVSAVPSAGGLTLLTASFGHVGAVHLAVNMYGLVQFLPPVALSTTFQASGSHLVAFYLSAGVLTTYAYHAASAVTVPGGWWRRAGDRVVGVRGASGAVMALVGTFGATYPDSRLGIVLVPGSLPASQFLGLLALFETYGLLVGFKRLPLAHAGHLAGLSLGLAYVHWDGQIRVWQPLRRWAFRQLQRLNIV